VGFETVNALWAPMLFESSVKFQSRLLQSHSRDKRVGRQFPFPNDSINLFLNVDERLLHVAAILGPHPMQSKQPAAAG
jgi:hypothetical protein